MKRDEPSHLDRQYMQNMHDMSKPAVWEKYEKYYNMTSADKILLRVLRVKQHPIKCSL